MVVSGILLENFLGEYLHVVIVMIAWYSLDAGAFLVSPLIISAAEQAEKGQYTMYTKICQLIPLSMYLATYLQHLWLLSSKFTLLIEENGPRVNWAVKPLRVYQ